MRPSRASMSSRFSARQKIAITSEATVMSNPDSRGYPLAGPPSDCTMSRKERSFMSSTRRHTTRRTSMSSALPQWIWLSSIAASRLCAVVIAWKSPVKWRLISSIGATCAWPPPVAPPFCPKHGPSDGSRRHSTARRPESVSASASPIEVVVLPSPAGVGLIAVTRISLPGAAPACRWLSQCGSILALWRP